MLTATKRYHLKLEENRKVYTLLIVLILGLMLPKNLISYSKFLFAETLYGIILMYFTFGNIIKRFCLFN